MILMYQCISCIIVKLYIYIYIYIHVHIFLKHQKVRISMHFNSVTKNRCKNSTFPKSSPPRASKITGNPEVVCAVPSGNAVSAQWQGRTFFLALHSPEAQKPIEVTWRHDFQGKSAGCDDDLCLLYHRLVHGYIMM